MGPNDGWHRTMLSYKINIPRGFCSPMMSVTNLDIAACRCDTDIGADCCDRSQRKGETAKEPYIELSLNLVVGFMDPETAKFRG